MREACSHRHDHHHGRNAQHSSPHAPELVLGLLARATAHARACLLVIIVATPDRSVASGQPAVSVIVVAGQREHQRTQRDGVANASDPRPLPADCGYKVDHFALALQWRDPAA